MRGSDRGSVTAEAAVVLPVLVLFGVLVMSGPAAMIGQIQCVDAARAGARAAARSEPPDEVIGAALSAAPAGATVEVGREGDLVRVQVTAESRWPLPLTLGAHAVALAEESVGTEEG